MKVLFSWLKDFVDVPGTAADVAAHLSVREAAATLGVSRSVAHRARASQKPTELAS